MNSGKKLELVWYEKDVRKPIEPRILIEKTDLSHSFNCNEKNHESNVLIHGDNLLALKAIESTYNNRIKCIYIDPPYNTGTAFEHYDDNLEHSIWLSLMRERLEILKELLSPDGVIFIQIDDNEQAYLKVLCDEVFGRDCFVNCIAIKMSPSSGVKRRFATIKFIKNKEYILVYKKKNITINPIYDEIDDYDVNYTIYFDGKEFCNLSEKLIKINPSFGEVDPALYLKYPKIKEFIVKNKEFIWRRHGHSKWVNGNMNDNNLIFKKTNDFVPRSRIWKVFNPLNSNEFEIIMNTRSGFERLEPISWKFVGDKMTLLRGDFWDGYESDMGNVSKEGKIGNLIFGEGQKPERLIKDIIGSVTKEGDYVLDSFLGSGTTVAVAQKMNRRWIGIEMGDQIFNICKPRLDSIIDGKDLSGVTKECNWKGGGSYKFYDLAPTLITKDCFGEDIINKEYSGTMLASAIALHENYIYQPDSKYFWKQSFNEENSFLYVTTRHVNKDLINQIECELKENEFLLIVCKSFDFNCLDGVKNISIKKIPQTLLKTCEFGVNDYSLNIVCPPAYEEDDSND